MEDRLFPQHVFPDTAEINDLGHLVVGGCDFVDLAKEFDTPLYVYDEETLSGRCREFLSEFRSRHSDTVVIYACKAYINPAIACLFMEEGLGLDVVSGGELTVARKVGFPSEKIYFHGNNKSANELKLALTMNVGRVIVDNSHELEVLNRLSAEVGKVQDILLRVSPGIDPHTHSHLTTGILDSKFGFSIETGQATEAIRKALAYPQLNLVGLHYHLGSSLFELEPFRLAMETVLRFAATFREEGFALKELSPGCGLGISYTRQQRPPSIGEFAEVLVSSMLDTCKNLKMELPRLIVEPGRSIAGPAGVAVYRVGNVKEIPGVRTYISVDGGMGDNIRTALYEAEYEAVAAGKMNLSETELVTVAGKYCESGDVLVRDVKLPPLQPDDLIAVPASGAYCPSMASNYNLYGRPAIVMVRGGQARLIRRRETFEDLMTHDVV